MITSLARELDQAEANANDAIGLIQTEEGALTETHSMLQRMTTLATQAANGTYATSEEGQTARDSIQKEVDELADEITRIAQNTKYNGLSPLDGSTDAEVTVNYTSVKSSDNPAANGLIAAADSEVGASSTAVKDTSYVLKEVNGKKSVAGTYTAADALDSAKDQAKALNKSNTDDNVKYIAVNQDDAKGTTYKQSVDGDTASTAYIIKDVTKGGNHTYNIEKKVTTNDLADDAAAKMTADAEAAAKADPIQLQVGPTSGETLSINQTDMTFAGLFGSENPTGGKGGVEAMPGLSTDVNKTSDGKKVLDMSSVDNANKAIDSIKNAINSVSSYRADLGAKQNRLEHTINNLKTTNENVTAAESRIRDTDMAKEIASYTKNNILSQAAQSMLAQANQSGQGVLTLLRG